ncbi:MAG: FtsX-like permease family protein [Candidatus Thorarchaeota archaeon]
MSVKLLITKVINYLFLTYELVLGNRRLIIPTMIGLIIALTVISQSTVLIETYRPEIFEEVVIKSLEGDYYGEGDINIDIWQQVPKARLESDDLFNYEEFDTIINKSIDQANYSDYISDFYWYSRISNYVWLNSTEEYSNEKIKTDSVPFLVSSRDEFYAALQHILTITGKGRFPINSSEVVFIRRKWDPYFNRYVEESDEFENVTLGAKVNITSSPSYRGGGPNKTVKIVGVIEFADYGPIPDNGTILIQKYFNRIYDNGFITHPFFVQQIIDELNQGLEVEVSFTSGCIISLDKTNFDAYNIHSEINKLQKFIRALEIQFHNAGYDSDVNTEILWSMRYYETYIYSLVIIILLLSLPVLCIALYLVVYSFNLIKKQKQEQIGIIKTRGGSWFQILVILLGEMLLSTVLAVILGFLLSTFLVDVVVRSTNYLEFLGSQIPIHITTDMVQGLIFWGLIFALLLNFRNIIRMSRQEIIETLEPTEKQKPVWKRYYLDVVMFVVGTATWVIMMTLIRTGGEMLRPEVYLLYIIVSFLGIPAPFFMFFGTIMVISRFFPFLMKKLAEGMWRIEGGINAFAIRNIVRHRQAANRAVLLITLALSFSILSSSLIYSLDETERLKQYYRVGADISVPTMYPLNNTIYEALNQNVSHITSISGVYSTWYYSYGFFDREYQFLFVDPHTYAETAFVDPHFKLSSSLSSLMNEIADNETIILYKGNLEAAISKPKIGGNISLFFEKGSTSEHLSFQVAGTFQYWPKMEPYTWRDPANSFWIIGSLGMFERLNQSNYFSDPPSAAYYAKIDSVENIDLVVERIFNVTGITPQSPILNYREYKTGFGRRFSLSILNSDLIVCITVAMIGVIMFAFFTYVERGKEIGVERALGMTQLQTAQSFLVEAATILTFGSIIGYFTGVYFVAMFLQILQFGESIPPMVVAYPTILLIQIILAIGITAGIGTIIPAYLATRKDISRILKVE